MEGHPSPQPSYDFVRDTKLQPSKFQQVVTLSKTFSVENLIHAICNIRRKKLLLTKSKVLCSRKFVKICKICKLFCHLSIGGEVWRRSNIFQKYFTYVFTHPLHLVPPVYALYKFLLRRRHLAGRWSKGSGLASLGFSAKS